MLQPCEVDFFTQSDERKVKLDQQRNLKLASSLPPSLPPSQLTCPVCKQRNIVYEAKQLRMKQDEGMDLICDCKNCGHHFRVRT